MPRGNHFLTGKEMDEWNQARSKSLTRPERAIKMGAILRELSDREPRFQHKHSVKWHSGVQ
jgi:hypothetical protein